jgi:alpha-1,2-mannosyltransferase
MTNLTAVRRWLPEASGAGWPMLVFLISASVMVASAVAGNRLLPGVSTRGFRFFDLRIYREAAEVAMRGGALYRARFTLGFGFTYPPVAALLFGLLALFPLRVDEVAIVLLNVGFVTAIAQLSVRLGRISGLPRSGRPARPGLAWIAAAVALWTEPVISTIGYGQIDLLLVVLVLADLVLGPNARWGGLGIGAAAALKLTPLIFIPYLALTGRIRMAGRALGAFVASIAVAFMALPRDAWSYWAGALLDTSRVTGHRRYAGRGPANQSLRGALMRLGGDVSHVGDVWLGLAALTGASGLWLAGRAGRRGNEALGFTLTAITGLLICPVSWTHHWVIALPGLLLVLMFPPPGLWGRVLAVLTALLAAGSPEIWLVIREDPGGGRLGAGGLLLGDLYVIVGVVVILTAAALELRRRGGDPPLRRRGPRAAAPRAPSRA